MQQDATAMNTDEVNPTAKSNSLHELRSDFERQAKRSLSVPLAGATVFTD